MAKGQMRSNREAKKPKQPKKPPSGLSPSRLIAPSVQPKSVDTQKKR
ncbi:hypothetical protein AAHK20_05215 [Trinickia sp. YCB016]